MDAEEISVQTEASSNAEETETNKAEENIAQDDSVQFLLERSLDRFRRPELPFRDTLNLGIPQEYVRVSAIALRLNYILFSYHSGLMIQVIIQNHIQMNLQKRV